MWNISVVGAYLVVSPPLPALGDVVGLRFNLPGDRLSIECQAEVRWVNEPSIFRGCGRLKRELPPGCGVAFVGLSPADVDRIESRVRVTIRAR
jgi:hypothetical protein